ncbi:MAG: DUF4476 domain-containing protein [Myxococcota bacterium]
MTRIALIVLAAFAAVTPAMSERSPADLMDRAQFQMLEMDHEINQVRNHAIRASLQERRDRVDRLLQRIENSGALEQRFHRNDRFDRGPQRPGIGQHRGVSFQDAMRSIRSARMDQDKLNAVRSAARFGRFTTEQAMRLADQLSFASNKAEALIILHGAVVDPQRFRIALEILDFSSNRRRVARTVGV